MIPSPEIRERLGSLALVVFSGVVVVTCTSAPGPRDRGTAPPVAASAPAPLASSAPEPVASAPASASALAAASASAPASPTTAPPVGIIPLPRFQAALRDLDDGKRKDHVRIVWLGDSHTAADFWTGAVRRVLQKAHGNGGPGFVHIGWAGAGYRHDGTRGIPGSTWKITPAAYAQSIVIDDGVFGLGGVRFEPQDAQSRTGIDVTDPALVDKPLSFELAYRLAAGADIPTMHVGEANAKLPLSPPGKIAHFKLTGAPGSHTMRLDGSNRIQLFGVVVEAAKPGVVLDTVGLNGARLGTALAWDEPAWVAELSQRKPELVVIAYGTNESQDLRGGAEKYGAQLDSLIARVRKGEPNADCLVITPIDRKDEAAAQRLAKIRDVLAAHAKTAGCAVWDAQAAMGGHGSMAAWAQESPPRAGGDGVHLTGKGYAALGDRLGKELLPAPRR